MKVLLFQVDGKLPNLALMRLSAWHRSRGDEPFLTNSLNDLWFLSPDRVYASSIFSSSELRRQQIAERYPDAVTGGTGYRFKSLLSEVIIDNDINEIKPDYSPYPNYSASLGYTQRGCRLDCAFCRMKTREGNATSVSTLAELWRGGTNPKHIHLLDNDFFGQELWRERLQEAIDGKYKLCFNQGINIRLINEEQAEMLVKAGYWDDSFKTRRLYTAWDNMGDEKAFKAGVETLKRGGVNPKHLMVYMLVGFRKGETEDEVLYRFNEMVALGCRPYPMVYDRSNKRLCAFQRWVIRRYYEFIPWSEYC